MAGPPPSSAQRPLPQLTPTCYNKNLGMGADNWASQYSRSNSEIPLSTPFPTCDSFGVGPYQCVIPPNQTQIQQGTGVFHPSRVSTEYRRANYNNNNIKGRRWIRQVGGSEDNGNGRGENSSKGEKKNGGTMKNDEECQLELKKEVKKKWNKKKNEGLEKKEELEECCVPNLPPGIVLPMEWPYPDSF